MNRKMIFFILGQSLKIEAALMLLPMTVALVCGENTMPFVFSIILTLCFGILISLRKPDNSTIFAREGFVAVSLVWICMSLCGALPFVFSGEIPCYLDALFETVSGFTTTGASVLTDIEACSKGILFWRSFTHWIGGLGVLVFIMAILPMSGEHSMHIMRAEVPGPVVGKLVPKAADTAKILYIIYAALTVLETLLLMLGGLSFFDALLHAFGTAGTGGFSTRNASIGAFGSSYVEIVVASFLVLFGINFNLYYLIAIRKYRNAVKSEELYVYLSIIAVSILSIAAGICPQYGSFAVSLRYAFFNVASIISTAGFCTEDFTLWPQYTQFILVLLMFCGACAGSTGGGIKISRVIILFKDSIANAIRMISPRRIKHVKVDGRTVPQSVIGTVSSFFFIYMLVLLACTLIVSFDGYDFATSFTASLSCISNIGPGLSRVGPSGNYAIFSAVPKLAMTVTMLLGRLEIYPVLILFASLFKISGTSRR